MESALCQMSVPPPVIVTVVPDVLSLPRIFHALLASDPTRCARIKSQIS